MENILEITQHENLDEHPDVTYTLNGVVIHTCHCLYNDFEKAIKTVAQAGNIVVLQTTIKESGENDTWQIAP